MGIWAKSLFDSEWQQAIYEVEKSCFGVAAADVWWQQLKDYTIPELVGKFGKETFIVYGVSGVHRYMLKEDGELLFSSYHATSDRVEIARTEGFTING